MTMVINNSMREARDEYLAENHFAPDGGNSEAWVNFKLGPIPLSFPNSDARRLGVAYQLPALALTPVIAVPWVVARRRYLRSLRQLKLSGLAAHHGAGHAAGEQPAHHQ